VTPARLRWAEIDLGALTHNVAELRARLLAGAGMVAVVKANGYGHGAVTVARTALAGGADWLAVATVEEAAELRAAGIAAPVLVMGPVAPGGEEAALALDVRLCIYDAGALERLARAADAAGTRGRLHLKVDTGMARLGCSPDEALLLARRIADHPRLQLEGLWTHFAEADDPQSSRTQEQLERYLGVVTNLAASGISAPILHCANSAAALLFPSTQLVLVRIGLPLYGYASAKGIDEAPGLRPVLSWKGRVVALHDLSVGDRVGYGGTFEAATPVRTATVSMGYADGYSRSLSGRGEVLLGGRRARLVGRVSMDYVTVDVTAIPAVALGDEAVFLGRQGDQEIDAEEIARSLGTISWEVLTMIGTRVERVTVGQGRWRQDSAVAEVEVAT
jgi:alanine racemase